MSRGQEYDFLIRVGTPAGGIDPTGRPRIARKWLEVYCRATAHSRSRAILKVRAIVEQVMPEADRCIVGSTLHTNIKGIGRPGEGGDWGDEPPKGSRRKRRDREADAQGAPEAFLDIARGLSEGGES